MLWNRGDGGSQHERRTCKTAEKDSLTHGIQVELTEDNRIRLDFHVIVAYGVSISAVTDNLISNVKYKVEEFSNMPVDKINVYIEAYGLTINVGGTLRWKLKR